MIIHNIIIKPFLLGLSSGLFCFTYCLPFVAPYMVFEERTQKENIKVVLKFILGRLFGYIVFGGLIGYLGERINDNDYVLDLVLNISLFGLSLILILYAIGLLTEKRGICLSVRVKSRAPLIMGFLMGVNVCPPFLMSITYIFTLHSWLKGIIFFVVFFLATTIYFIPSIFLGFLNRMKEFRMIARISAILVGVLFLAYSGYYIIRIVRYLGY